jgi:hypothetical protein
MYVNFNPNKCFFIIKLYTDFLLKKHKLLLIIFPNFRNKIKYKYTYFLLTFVSKMKEKNIVKIPLKSLYLKNNQKIDL